MNKKFIAMFLILLLSFNVFTAKQITASELKTFSLQLRNSTSNNINEEKKFMSGSVIVVIKKEYSGLNKTYSLEDFEGVDISRIEYLTPLRTDTNNELIDYENYKQILNLKLSDQTEKGVLEALDVLKNIYFIENASPDYYIESDIVEETTPTLDTTNPFQLYNTTASSIGWNMTKIGMNNAWTLETGSSDVQVGIIDSGIVEHEDLIDNVTFGWDFYNNVEITSMDPTGEDLNNIDYFGEHGTEVAGIVGAIGDNDIGISGVAWNISLVPLRYKNSNYTSHIINAISYAQDHDIEILNCSFNCDEITRTAFDNYEGLIICSAGNASTDNDLIAHYPSGFDFDNIIAVANSDDSDSLFSQSNYGLVSVDLAAPGVDIVSTSLNGTYKHVEDSTSIATPHVTGAAALLKSYNSDLNAYQMKHAILDNVDEVSALNGKVSTGGRLNVYNALLSVIEGQVKNYIVKVNFTNNTGAINSQLVTMGFDKKLLRYCSSTGGDECGNEWITENSDYITFNGDFSSCTDEEGTIVTMRFNMPFIDVNCLSSINVTNYEAEMANTSDDIPTLEVYKALVGDVASPYNVIDNNDITVLTDYINNSTVLSEEQMLAADINEDGIINSKDVNKLTNYVNKKIDSLQ